MMLLRRFKPVTLSGCHLRLSPPAVTAVTDAAAAISQFQYKNEATTYDSFSDQNTVLDFLII